MPPTQHHNLFADDFSTNPWWWRDMPPAPTGLKDVPDQTDVVVIGGGYAGLSCALELAQAGGAVIVIDATRDLFALATTLVRFFRNESCGKCVPCRIGSEKAVELLEDVQAGTRETTELQVLTELGETLEQTSICGLGQVALNPILSMLECFPEEMPAHQ